MARSTDGWLTCTVDGPTASVLLLVDFGSASNSSSIRTVTVFRTTAGMTVPVRGADTTPALGGYHAAIDHEPLLAAPLAYRAVGYNAAGVAIRTSTTVPLMIPAEPFTAWLRCLLIPRLSQRVVVDTYPDWTDGLDQSIEYPYGQQFPTVGEGQQQAGQGSVVLAVRDPGVRESLRTLLAVGGTYLFQPSRESTEPQVYVTRGVTGRARPYQQSTLSKRLFTLPLVVVDRPSTIGSVVQLPGRTAAEAPARPLSAYPVRSVDWAGR